MTASNSNAPMGSVSLTRFADTGQLARTVAETWLTELATAPRPPAPPCVALSGGRVARQLFAETAALAKGRRLFLHSVHFFWADERCVPPDDEESNYRAAQERLLAPLGIAARQIHRICGEHPPEAAAQAAQAELLRIAPVDATRQPVLDLILLGMGEDGHVASLFPDEPEAAPPHQAIYRAIQNSPKPPPQRVTLGYATLAAARQVWVLIAGAGKAAALRESLSPTGRTPLARVIQSRPRTRIFSDVSLG